ncbi:MAG: DUF3048 domain-containing protein [Nocardioidaceae bacterium]
MSFVRPLGVVSLAAALILGLAACGSSDKKGTPPPTNGSPTPPTNTVNPLTLNGEWPLTGLKLNGDLPKHPVYVVKIDNTTSSAPQIGLKSADMVVQELVEGGLTRLAVFYYSHVPDLVGPVRSMRASDIGIVKSARANLVASGGAPPTVRLLRAAHIHTFTQSAPGFYRNNGRPAPYNLFMKLKELVNSPQGKGQAPLHPYMAFGPANNFHGNITVTRIAATFAGGDTTQFQHTPQGWTRPGSFSQPGQDFKPDNILLLRVKVGNAGYLDPAGNPVPETDFYGKGAAVLVHGTKAVKCTWAKRGKPSELRLWDNGKPVKVPAGHTWIALVPAATGSVALAK